MPGSRRRDYPTKLSHEARQNTVNKQMELPHTLNNDLPSDELLIRLWSRSTGRKCIVCLKAIGCSATIISNKRNYCLHCFSNQSYFDDYYVVSKLQEAWEDYHNWNPLEMIDLMEGLLIYGFQAYVLIKKAYKLNHSVEEMDRMYDFLNTTIFKPKDYYNSVYETYDQPYLNTSNGYLCKNYELDPPCEDIEKLRSSLTALSYNELKDEFMNFTPGLYEIMLADFSSDESETLNGVTDQLEYILVQYREERRLAEKCETYLVNYNYQQHPCRQQTLTRKLLFSQDFSMEVRILEKEIKGIVKDIDDLGTWMKEIREFMNTRLVRQAYQAKGKGKQLLEETPEERKEDSMHHNHNSNEQQVENILQRQKDSSDSNEEEEAEESNLSYSE